MSPRFFLCSFGPFSQSNNVRDYVGFALQQPRCPRVFNRTGGPVVAEFRADFGNLTGANSLQKRQATGYCVPAPKDRVRAARVFVGAV